MHIGVRDRGLLKFESVGAFCMYMSLHKSYDIYATQTTKAHRRNKVCSTVGIVCIQQVRRVTVSMA